LIQLCVADREADNSCITARPDTNLRIGFPFRATQSLWLGGAGGCSSWYAL